MRELALFAGDGRSMNTKTDHSAVNSVIRAECDRIAELLIQKNTAYGNSVFEPVGVFAKGDWLDAVHVRIDDKLSRIARGEAAGEDAELDLIGYLILKRVGLRIYARMSNESDDGRP